jgi:hypothetical protein
MDSSQALTLVQQILHPKRLNSAQEVVVSGSWAGKRYQEMATDSGYDFDYLKEVGSQLWSVLSQAIGRTVTKKSLRIVLTEVAPERLLERSQQRFSAPSRLDLAQFPSEAIPLESGFYVERPPIETLACQAILRPGGFIRMKAPRQTGKTSLIVRVSASATQQGMRPVSIDLRTAERNTLKDLNQFLQWLCVNVARQIGVPHQLEPYWDEASGSKMSCHIYFQEHLLKASEQPLLLILDELNQIFEYPEVAQDFLPLLRSWHDEAARNLIWQRLRLVMAYSTEIYIPLNLNQSPFNVGLSIDLPFFTMEQTRMLAERYQLELADDFIPTVYDLIAGHPYLTQLLFHRIAQSYTQSATQSEAIWPDILANAATPIGIYRDHLKSHLVMLQQAPELSATIERLLKQEEPVSIDTVIAHKLESVGLIRWVNPMSVVISCRLYRDYLTNYRSMS